MTTPDSQKIDRQYIYFSEEYSYLYLSIITRTTYSPNALINLRKYYDYFKPNISLNHSPIEMFYAPLKMGWRIHIHQNKTYFGGVILYININVENYSIENLYISDIVSKSEKYLIKDSKYNRDCLDNPYHSEGDTERVKFLDNLITTESKPLDIDTLLRRISKSYDFSILKHKI